jgi:hypothetical protein
MGPRNQIMIKCINVVLIEHHHFSSWRDRGCSRATRARRLRRPDSPGHSARAILLGRAGGPGTTGDSSLVWRVVARAAAAARDHDFTVVLLVVMGLPADGPDAGHQ